MLAAISTARGLPPATMLRRIGLLRTDLSILTEISADKTEP